MKAILSTVIILEKIGNRNDHLERDGHEQETIEKTNVVQAN
jgi:hypothetical protein